MIYGIDLGTTNSLIGLNDKLLSGMVPSIVDMKTGKAGESQRANYDTMRNFKTSMVSEASGYSAMIASSHVLKELKAQAGLTDKIKAVISVPAYFNSSQRIATVAAANLANIECVATINEPTAAAMAISKNAEGIFIVFDLGGGTFDISVIESKNGMYRVLATDGCILGGKDFDAALLVALGNESGLNWRIDDNENLDIVSKAKIEMQKTGKDVTVYFPNVQRSVTLTQKTYLKCMQAIFEKAVLLTQSVIDESQIDVATTKFYFVGGSTRCPYLREWVSKRLNINAADIVYNPDTIVAEGACYYATLLSTGKAVEMLQDVTKQIGMKINSDIMEIIIPKNAHLPYKNDYIFVASKEKAVKSIHLSFYEGDSILASECNWICDLDFEFKEEMPARTSIFGLRVEQDLNRKITFKVDEMLQPPVIAVRAGGT